MPLNPLKILILEDDPNDLQLICEKLEELDQKTEIKAVENEEGYRSGLLDFKPDIILVDYHIPGYDGMFALQMAREVSPYVPFVFVTGLLGEELAAETILSGASGLVLKSRLERLPGVIEKALSVASYMKKDLNQTQEKIREGRAFLQQLEDKQKKIWPDIVEEEEKNSSE